MDESKDRGEDSPREIYRESFYKIFSDEKVSLFSFSLSLVLSSMTYCEASIIRSCIQFFDHAVDLGWILVELWWKREL